MISWSEILLFKIKKKLNKLDEKNLSKSDLITFKKAEECPTEMDKQTSGETLNSNNFEEGSKQDLRQGGKNNRKKVGSWWKLKNQKTISTIASIDGKRQLVGESATQHFFSMQSSWNDALETTKSMFGMIYKRTKRSVSSANTIDQGGIPITDDLRETLRFTPDEEERGSISQSKIQEKEYRDHGVRIINNRMNHSHSWHVGQGDDISEDQIPEHFRGEETSWMQQGVKDGWNGIRRMHSSNLDSMISQKKGGGQRGISGVLRSFKPLKNSANLNVKDRVLDADAHISEMEIFQGDNVDETLKKMVLAQQQIDILGIQQKELDENGKPKLDEKGKVIKTPVVEHVYNHVKTEVEDVVGEDGKPVIDPETNQPKQKEKKLKSPVDVQYRFEGNDPRRKSFVSSVVKEDGTTIKDPKEIETYLQSEGIEQEPSSEVLKEVSSEKTANARFRSFLTDEEKNTLSNNPSQLFKEESKNLMVDSDMEQVFLSDDALAGRSYRMLNSWHLHHLDDKAGEAEAFEQIRDYGMQIVDKNGVAGREEVALRDVSSPDFNLTAVPERDHLDLNHNTAESTVMEGQYGEGRSVDTAREEDVIRMNTISQPDGVDEDGDIYFYEIYLDDKERDAFYESNPDWEEKVIEYKTDSSRKKKYIDDPNDPPSHRNTYKKKKGN